MARPRGLSRGQRPDLATRRNLQWTEGPGGNTVTTITTSSTTILGAGLLAIADVFTIRRLHGFLTLQLNVVGAVGDGFHYAIGYGVVTQDAFAVGVSAMPNPLDDIDWGWMWHRLGAVHAITATIADGVNAAGVQERIQVDGEAMRVLGSNDVVFCSIQTQEAGTSELDVFMDSRLLLAS